MAARRSGTDGVAVWAVLAVLPVLALAGARPARAQEIGIGIKAKRPVFGGACKTCPWGALAEIVKTALQPYGYDVQICYNCARADAPRIVAGARTPPPWRSFPPIPDDQMPRPPNGPVDFGATSVQNLWWAYEGSHAYAKEEPRKNLRLLATIQSPNYLMVAARADLGITDLRQVKEKRWPVRILTDANEATTAVLAYYGLSKETVEAAGGHLGSGFQPEERKSFDVIIHGGTLANAPEFNVWYEVSQKFDLRFLELPDDLLARLARDFDMERRSVPLGLLRGIDRPLATVARTGHAVYGRADMPDDFAYTVARALDEHQDLLQWGPLLFSYNLRTVWKAFEVPLHPGAARYYRERSYMR